MQRVSFADDVFDGSRDVAIGLTQKEAQDIGVDVGKDAP